MTARVASIYFAPVRAERAFGGPFEIAPVPLGATPAILVIADRIQIEQGPYQMSSDGNHRSRRDFLVRGETIAADIVAEWTQNGVGMNPQCRPGIWVVRERIAEVDAQGRSMLDGDGRALWRDATDAERLAMWEEDLAAAQAADRAYAEHLFVAANAMAEEPKLIPFIPKTARLGAKQYGLEAEWLREGAALRVKSCPYCTKVIPERAIKCPRCAEIVDVEEYARPEVIRKAEVARMQLELGRQRSMERAQQSVLARKQAAMEQQSDDEDQDSAQHEAPEVVTA